MPPESKLVLACARARLDEPDLHWINHKLLNLRVDWHHVADIAQQHRIAPLLYRSLRRLALPAASKPAMQILKQAYLAAAARNSILFRALERILDALTSAGMPVIVLKGAFLADAIYPERALRPMADIDLLIRDEDLEGAQEQLRRIGYAVAHDPKTKQDLRGTHHHWVFRHTGPVSNGIPLEVHWNLHPPNYPFHVDLEGLWERAVPSRIAGVTALGLAPEDLILHLCTHAARHRFNVGLISLCDIAAVIDQYGDRIDWPRLETRSAEWCSSPYVAVALGLAAQLSGASVPAETLMRLRKSDGDHPMLELARERILEEKGVVRAAAEFRLRCLRRGARGSVAALRESLSRRAVAGHGSDQPSSAKAPFSQLALFRTLLRRYLPLTWSLVRHPRTIAAIVRREARKSQLDSWCSPGWNGTDAAL